MFIYREIVTSESVAKEAAQIIQKYSWGLDYPVDAWDEVKQSEYIIGCFNNEELVGFANITRVASPDSIDNGLPWLADAVVIPEYRNQGIFKKLYEYCIRYLQQHDEELVLTCTDNPIVEKFLMAHAWELRRITTDESGGECEVFQFNPKTVL